VVVVAGGEPAEIQPVRRQHRIGEHRAQGPHAPLVDRAARRKGDQHAQHQAARPDRRHATHPHLGQRLLLRREAVLQRVQHRQIEQHVSEARRRSGAGVRAGGLRQTRFHEVCQGLPRAIPAVDNFVDKTCEDELSPRQALSSIGHIRSA